MTRQMRSVRHFAKREKCLTLRQGQSTIETALLLGAVAIALVAIFAFVRNAVSSRIKTGSDAFGHGMLYEGRLGQSTP